MTNKQLKKFVKSKIGTPYVYGMKGKVMTMKQYNTLKQLYPKYVWDVDILKVGLVCVDCSGLVGWGCGVYRSSQGYRNYGKDVHTIDSIKTAPVGVAVWKQGHIGVYIGCDSKGVAWCVEAKGSKYGVSRTRVDSTDWTHWFKLDCIEYK